MGKIKYYRCGGAIGNSLGEVYRNRGSKKEFKKLLKSFSEEWNGFYGEETAYVLAVVGQPFQADKWVIVAYSGCKPEAFAKLRYKDGDLISVKIKEHKGKVESIMQTDTVEYICFDLMKDIKESKKEVVEISKETYDNMCEIS